ncbi:ParA family protein [Christensenellaceae bacterium OttesenSCG-928-L17]|nr:ParA family protein [Christensenellaceae bacterium OttesenSCG-928-L17]
MAPSSCTASVVITTRRCRAAQGVYFMPANLKLADTELSLVPAMNREKILSVYVDEVKNGYDYILIDCPPSLGMLTINAFVAADSVIIPVQAEYLPADAMAQLTKSIARVRRFQNPKLEVEGIVFTMVDERTNLARLSIETIETHFGQHFHIFESKIPRSVRVAEQPAFGKSIYALDSDGNAAKAYRALSKEVYNRGRQIELERKHGIGIGSGGSR